MKLLIAADIFPPESGGPATYAVTLANELTKLGDEVAIVSLNPDSDKSVLDTRIKLFSVFSRSKLIRYAHYFWLLYKKAKNVDVIYAMGPVNAGWPAMLVASLRKKKFVVKVVGDYAWEQGQVLGVVKDGIDAFQKKTYSGKIGTLQDKERQVVRMADVVITPSKYLKEIVSGWGAPKEKIKVVYNAVRLSDINPAPKPPNEFWIISSARLVPWKGMAILIEAMSAILKEVPHAKLKIIGDGPERGVLKQLVKNRGLENSVALLGNLAREHFLSYLHAADVCVLNSGYEGLSHVLVEALGFNVYVLASDRGGNPEIVIPGETGELFEYNNKTQIEMLLIKYAKTGIKNTPLLRSGERVEFFSRFEIHTMVAETRKILEELCAN